MQTLHMHVDFRLHTHVDFRKRRRLGDGCVGEKLLCHISRHRHHRQTPVVQLLELQIALLIRRRARVQCERIKAEIPRDIFA